MSDKYVKLKNLEGFDDEFLNALSELELRIFEDYDRFMPSKGNKGFPETVPGEHPMFTEFKNDFGYSVKGRKYLKLVMGAFGERNHTSVWGFIAKADFKVNNKKKSGGPFIDFKEGDLLKPAGWNTPALNSPRGNIFSDDYSVGWTGPKYL